MNEEMGHHEREDWPATAPAEPSPSISRIEFEKLFGGRVLAWIGGFATLLGLVFLMRSAVDSSWFTEEIRTLAAALGSLLLLGLGVWLHEKKGRLEAARVAVAVAIPGLYATTVVATQTYDLISPVIGLELGALIGVIGVAIAVRWSSMLVGSVGILGALAAPMLVGTASEGGLDRLRRPRAGRQRRRPPLAALELVGVRRLRRLGAPTDRLDSRDRVLRLLRG